MLDARPIYPEVEQAMLEFWLSKLRENLTADAAGTRTFLGKDSPEELAARLAKSRLADPAYRKQLWDGGLAAVMASDDPMIKFVLATDAASRAIRKQYEERVLGPSDRGAATDRQGALRRLRHQRLSRRHLHACASATARSRAGRKATTTFRRSPISAACGNARDRETRRSIWRRNGRPRSGHVNDKTVFDFTTDNDIVGGNSGSPAIDAKGDVIGAAFDGNIHSLGGAFAFDERDNRSVMVSTAAITEALKNVYHADRLVAELTGH